MQVAYVCADRGIPVFGHKGCSIHVQEIVRGLLKKGIKVKLFASRLGGDLLEDLKEVEVYEIPRMPKQDAKHFDDEVNNFNLFLKEKLYEQGPFDFVYERYSLWSQGAMEYAQELKIPGILEVNAPLIMEEETHRNLIHKELAQKIEQGVFLNASEIVVVSDEVGKYVALKMPPPLKPKINVVPNGINPDRFIEVPDLRQKYRKKNQCTIGFVGSLKPWHGVDLLLESFVSLYQENKTLRLLIVGDGPEMENIKTFIKNYKLESAIYLTGAVRPDLIPRFLSIMDIAVAPYPALENFYFSPLKVYEYMAAGLPVVVSRIGQLEKLIKENENGLFFEPGDMESLKKSLKKLIEETSLRKKLAQTGQQTVLKDYTWHHVVEKIVDLSKKTSSMEALS